MTEGVLRLPANEVIRLIKQGDAHVVDMVRPSGPPKVEPTPKGALERAKEIMGEDFLGVEAVKMMESALKAKGLDVAFSLDNLPHFPYSEKDLELAKQQGEMVILRAEKARIDGRETPLTIINFRELFRKDPVGSLATPFFSFNQDATDWYINESFATDSEMQLGWAIVKKEVLPGSTSKKFRGQDDVLKQYGRELQGKGANHSTVRRRTANEAVWDEMLYYTNNQEQLLPSTYDWTSSQTSRGGRVYLGFFDSGGLVVGYWSPDYSGDRIGVCPSR